MLVVRDMDRPLSRITRSGVWLPKSGSLMSSPRSVSCRLKETEVILLARGYGKGGHGRAIDFYRKLIGPRLVKADISPTRELTVCPIRGGSGDRRVIVGPQLAVRPDDLQAQRIRSRLRDQDLCQGVEVGQGTRLEPDIDFADLSSLRTVADRFGKYVADDAYRGRSRRQTGRSGYGQYRTQQCHCDKPFHISHPIHSAHTFRQTHLCSPLFLLNEKSCFRNMSTARYASKLK